MRALSPVFLLCTIVLTACGGSTTSTSPLSGNWQFALTNPATGAVKLESGFFLQSGSLLNGNVLLTGSTVCAGVGSAQGTVTGPNVSIAVSQVGQTINLNGMTEGSGSAMSGNYSIIGSACGTTQVGTWTANQVAPLTGNFQATFTQGGGGTVVIHFTGAITQGPNSGGSTTTLNGTMTSTDSPCFTDASITGQISGSAVLFNLADSEGITLGQFIGTVTKDASSITGTYDLFPQAANSCTNYGTATISVQHS
jgi:hypothetical protein